MGLPMVSANVAFASQMDRHRDRRFFMKDIINFLERCISIRKIQMIRNMWGKNLDFTFENTGMEANFSQNALSLPLITVTLAETGS